MGDVWYNTNIGIGCGRDKEVVRLEKLIRGQKINPVKLGMAKELRRNMTEEEKRLWVKLKKYDLRSNWRRNCNSN
ncbi:hypothetical protein EDC14_100714 [Hydrogenispora ethanolica]|uniref:DUF559 domain-containing protein n=1 Tax=Hydrogenispora ethanolica TaxID=1082276 RepID=A0A4R1RZW3_HYDET|nr:hypothetical protein EDC14_100714 [Hydrogenispora ethanolica]